MKRSKQAGKYILSDFVSASVAWLLFNILRYEILFIINEGTDSLLDYLQYPGVLTGQIVIPFFWLVLYYFSGYYNKPFGKSRLTELFSTFITVLIGTIFVFFALLLDDIPVRSISIIDYSSECSDYSFSLPTFTFADYAERGKKNKETGNGR